MANVLQDYFQRMNALNRQRGMTGNMQYAKALDGSIAEGYFDSYQKNKAQSQSLANQQKQLAISQQQADTARYSVDSQNALYSKALNQNNLLGWGGLAAQALGTGVKLYLGQEQTPTISMNQNALQYGSPEYTTAAKDLGMAPLEYGSPEYNAEAAKWGVEDTTDTSYMGWFDSLYNSLFG